MPTNDYTEPGRRICYATPAPAPEDDSHLPPEFRRRTEWVYVLRAIPSGKIKIGRTRDIPRRIRELQTATWEFLDVLAEIPDEGNLERKLHKRFASYCIQSEWFHPGPKLIEWLQKLGVTL